MVYRSVRPFALVALGLTLVVVSCSSDSTTTPGNGNASQTLTLAPGVYILDGTIVDCATMNPIQSEHQTVPICVSDPVETFFGFSCPIKRTGNTLSISCDLTNDVYAGCTVTTTIRGNGTVSGTIYKLSGTIDFTDEPVACADSTICWAFDLEFDKVDGAPSGCAYADVGTIALQVAGGSQPGKHILRATGGGANQGAGTISFGFSGTDSNVPLSALAPATSSDASVAINVAIPPIDPQTLPQTLPIEINLGATTASSGGAGSVNTAVLTYNEVDATNYFYATGVTSGSITVNELALNHIAGRMSMVLTGTQYTGGTPSQEQRTIAGGYFIFNDVENVTQPPTSAGIPGRGIVSGWLADLMRDARP